jgi:hypothetical protein
MLYNQPQGVGCDAVARSCLFRCGFVLVQLLQRRYGAADKIQRFVDVPICEAASESSSSSGTILDSTRCGGMGLGANVTAQRGNVKYGE